MKFQTANRTWRKMHPKYSPEHTSYNAYQTTEITHQTVHFLHYTRPFFMYHGTHIDNTQNKINAFYLVCWILEMLFLKTRFNFTQCLNPGGGVPWASHISSNRGQDNSWFPNKIWTKLAKRYMSPNTRFPTLGRQGQIMIPVIECKSFKK